MVVNNLSKEANKVIYIKFGSINFEGTRIFRKKEKIVRSASRFLKRKNNPNANIVICGGTQRVENTQSSLD